METIQAGKLPRAVPWALDQAEAGERVTVTRHGLPVAILVPARGFVHLWVTGHYAGAYAFATLEEAEADAAERRATMGPPGIRYAVSESAEEPEEVAAEADHQCGKLIQD